MDRIFPCKSYNHGCKIDVNSTYSLYSAVILETSNLSPARVLSDWVPRFEAKSNRLHHILLPCMISSQSNPSVCKNVNVHVCSTYLGVIGRNSCSFCDPHQPHSKDIALKGEGTLLAFPVLLSTSICMESWWLNGAEVQRCLNRPHSFDNNSRTHWPCCFETAPKTTARKH